MGFELFKEYGRGNRPTCSLRSNGQLGFNRGALRAFELRDGYVQMYFDREKRLVGIKPVGEAKIAHSTKLNVRDRNAFISARSFLDYYEVDYRNHTTTYEAKLDEQSGLIIVDLAHPLHVRNQSTDDASGDDERDET